MREEFKMTAKIFRHGDLLIREIWSIPSDAVQKSTNIIAEGEKTGHNHQLVGSHQIFETDEAIIFVDFCTASEGIDQISRISRSPCLNILAVILNSSRMYVGGG
jgi:hypothetical protein